jgi:hypothetical protein
LYPGIFAACLKEWIPPAVDGTDADAAIFVVAEAVLTYLASMKKK